MQADRLAGYFKTLCEINSPGLEEREVARYLKKFFSLFPVITVEEDDSALKTGSDTGNIVVTIPGHKADATGLFFACHMDVIHPCDSVKVDFSDGVFRSVGDTVLGGDDKAGIAILMELTHLLLEGDTPYPTVQFIFTTGEEIGLLGATHLDHDLLQVEYGYALDSTGVDNAIIGAPAAVYIDAVITGRAAHAGLNPEDGINAIALCGEVVGHLSLGRIDEDTTANIGLIEGGTATNIIPEVVHVKGEIRSHDQCKLEQTIEVFKRTFENICSSYGGSAKVTFPPQYPSMAVEMKSPVAMRIQQAGKCLGREIDFIVAGGGSDANIFNFEGLPTVILGTGMTDVHSTKENIALSDMARTAELVVALVTC
jgi:tripeptide aminopeptidase